MHKLRYLIAVLAALTAVGSALAVVGGSPDNGAHPYVGAAIQAVNGGHELCSGSLVSATVFVTAAHCFPDGSTVQVTFDEVAVNPDRTINSAATFYTGTVHNDPGFCLGCGPGLIGFDTNDIAVIVLDGQGAPQPQSRYAQLPAIGQVDTLPNRQQVEIVGYGVQAFAPPKTPAVFGTRQDATATVIGKFGTEYLKLSDDPGACFGDSGGPDLLPGTDIVLVSENSYTAGNPICNGVSYAERLDTSAAQEFINSFL